MYFTLYVLFFNLYTLFFFLSDFDMSDAQCKHAEAVERLVPRLAALRIELCPAHMSKGNFWMVYFVLLYSRLSRHDAEMLSTQQVTSKWNYNFVLPEPGMSQCPDGFLYAVSQPSCPDFCSACCMKLIEQSGFSDPYNQSLCFDGGRGVVQG